MKTLSVLGVDPGETTGLALFTVIDVEPFHLVPSRQLQLPWLEATLWVEQVCMTWFAGTLLVACERFVITPNTAKTMHGEQDWSIEGVGCARRDSLKYGHGPLALYSASDAKKFVSNENLKKVGWDCPTPGNHARDATRIAVIAAADKLKIVPPWV